MSQQAIWVRGAILLTIAGFISKFLGMVYRVPLQNITGDEGLYIYQQIYPIISIALLLSIYSLPGAISHVMVNYRETNAPIHLPNEWVVFSLLLGFGSLIFALIVLNADVLAYWMGDENLSDPIQIAGAMFLLIPISSSLRGFFQGLELTQYVAISQIIEQFFRVISIIVFIVVFFQWTDSSIYSVGNLVAWATIIGTSITILYLFITYQRKIKSLAITRGLKINTSIIKMLFVGVIIYSLNYMLHLVLQVVDVFTMVELLQSFGHTFEEAKVTKGVFDRSHPMIQLGLVIGSSLALALIPSLDENYSHQLLAFKWTFLLALSATVGLITVMPFLNPLLFKTNDGLIELQWMMLLVFLLSMAVVLSVFLQHYNYRFEQFKWIVVMVGIKYSLNLILIPMFGSLGSSLAYVLAASFVLILFLWKWAQLSNFKLPLFFIIKATFIIGLMGVIVFGLQYEMSAWVDESDRLTMIPYTLLLCLAGVIVVSIGVVILKLFSKDEIKQVIGKRLERSK